MRVHFYFQIAYCIII